MLIDGKGPHQHVIEAVEALGEQFDWTITRANYKDVIAAAEAATIECEAKRPVNDHRITPEEDAARKQANEKRNEDFKRVEQERKEAAARIMAKKPAGARAVIVAELEQDDCDTQSDYFNTTTARRCAIGWRFSAREDFKRLREVAATFEETKHLGPDAPEEIEHRENYSRGKGNYLKDGGCYDSGWVVKSVSLDYFGSCWEYEDCLDEAPASVEGESITVSENDEKDGIEIRFDQKRYPRRVEKPGLAMEPPEQVLVPQAGRSL